MHRFEMYTEFITKTIVRAALSKEIVKISKQLEKGENP